jgi:ribosomal protein L21E
MNIGDRVRIERDETRYPSKGTWPRFRGKTGTVVEINLGEYGVAIGVRCDSDRLREAQQLAV